MFEILQGDCLELMKNIPDKSIDCIICDLPFGTTACSWDIILPFEDLWLQYNRIAKPNAPIILFSSQPFTSLLVVSNIKNYKEELIWLKNKSASGLHAKQRHIKVHENICVFAKGSYTYNPQKWEVKEKEFLVKRKVFDYGIADNNVYGKIRDIKHPDDGTRNPISVIPCQVPFTPHKNKTYDANVDVRVHPTQKPLELLEYLVRTYSNENDLVLDNCMGSGTTGVACIKLHRNFIGIEKDETYFNIAKERLENA